MKAQIKLPDQQANNLVFTHSLYIKTSVAN